jgi:hypothetical protein
MTLLPNSWARVVPDLCESFSKLGKTAVLNTMAGIVNIDEENKDPLLDRKELVLPRTRGDRCNSGVECGGFCCGSSGGAVFFEGSFCVLLSR